MVNELFVNMVGCKFDVERWFGCLREDDRFSFAQGRHSEMTIGLWLGLFFFIDETAEAFNQVL
jgi:hypothetical protein